MLDIETQPAIFVRDNVPLTNSTAVAEYFHKDHKKVLRDIRNLDIGAELARSWFIETTALDSYGRTQPAYDMTRDGFTVLAFGWTGKQAMVFKIAYIAEFNRLLASGGARMTPSQVRQMIREETTQAVKDLIPLLGHVIKGIHNKRAALIEQHMQSGMDTIREKLGEVIVKWMTVSEVLQREGMLGHRGNGALAKTLHYRLRQFANRRDRGKERSVQAGEDVYTTALVNDYLALGGGQKLLDEHRARRNKVRVV